MPLFSTFAPAFFPAYILAQNEEIIDHKKTIHLALLGCGFASKIHSKTIRRVDKSSKVSFASRSPEKADNYRKKYKGFKSFDSYEAAINDPDVDVIMINTPPASHFDLAKKALEARKHVIVEKPPFPKSTDFDILGNLAEQQQKQLLIAENYYYKPLRYKIYKLLQSGVIGDPLFINISATKKQINSDWRNDENQSLFGALYEGGIHWINFMNNIGFEIKDIQGVFPGKKEGLDKSVQVMAETKDGPVMNLSYSWEVDTVLKGIFRKSRIYGIKGSISFETNGIYVWVRGEKIRFFMPNLRDIAGYGAMFKDFFKAISEQKNAQFTWQMAKNDLELIEKIYKNK